MPVKEMVGYYTDEGLIINWPKGSTNKRTTFKYSEKNGEKYYRCGNKDLKINGFVHTHPSLVPDGIGISQKFDVPTYNNLPNNFQIIYNGQLYQMVGPDPNSYIRLRSIY